MTKCATSCGTLERSEVLIHLALTRRKGTTLCQGVGDEDGADKVLPVPPELNGNVAELEQG